VILVTSKLFFAVALDLALIGAISCGATTILNDSWPAPEQIAAQVARYRPTMFFSVPTFYRRLLALPPEQLEPFRGVAFTHTGGERLPDTVFRQWGSVVGTEILVGYGMSETFCQAFSNFPMRTRLGSCGVPLMGVEVKLLGDAGDDVGVGELGALWLRHPALTLRYKDDANTEQAFRDGWFRTNDLFVQDRDGYLFHQGRIDELYRVAGMWVKPAEVEEAVLADGRIREAACALVPDGDGFERLALFVTPAGGEGTAESAAHERCAVLPRHSRPKWVREVTELPRTSTGKVQRFVLRQRLVSELERGETPS
jgi:acyl-coenzyme A synthetase/AMP-(fatty) acid ligase